jgi:hypothetical protein
VGSFRENQTFNTISYFCVAKMQHCNQTAGRCAHDDHSITSSSPPTYAQLILKIKALWG